MYIKIKKIIKTIFILMIIFNYSLSYAAISVADGASFVTKAEFASALNNLSNRLSVMENNVDSKIDSLVSAYLVKNGIWNGEVQTLESITQNNKYIGISSTTRSGTSSSSKKNVYWAHGEQVQTNALSFNATTTSTVYTISNYGNISKLKIFTPSKTGLAFIKIYWKSKVEMFHLYYISRTGSYEFYCQSTIRFRNNANNIYVESSNSYNYTLGWGAHDYSHSLNMDTYETLLLFVEKNDVIYEDVTTSFGAINIGFMYNNSFVGWEIVNEGIIIY